MEIKSILSGLRVRPICLFLVVMVLASCQTAEIRNQKNPSQKSEPPGQIGNTVSQPPEIPAGQTSSQRESVKTSLSTRRQFGLILGPGGLKSAAHVGFLRGMVEAGQPIKALVGLEWGSLPAGLFASSGKPNDVEWKFFKIKRENLPAPSLIGGKFETASVDRIFGFLDTTFGSTRIESLPFRFACPTFKLDRQEVIMISKGLLRDAISFCLPNPPLFRTQKGFYGSSRSVEAAAKWLREQGAEKIIYVDVMARENLGWTSSFQEANSAQLLWAQNQSDLKTQLQHVDYVARIDTRSIIPMQVDGAREGVELGYDAAKVLFGSLKD